MPSILPNLHILHILHYLPPILHIQPHHKILLNHPQLPLNTAILPILHYEHNNIHNIMLILLQWILPTQW